MRMPSSSGSGDLAAWLGLSSANAPISGGVSFQWRKPSLLGRAYDLLGPDDSLVGVAERRSRWSLRSDLRFALTNGERLDLRTDGGLLTREYHITNLRGDWLASWQRSWNRRRMRIGPYQLRAVRAGLFTPWSQAETDEREVAMRWRGRWEGFRRDVEVTVYPNQLPDLTPQDWLTMALLALHISLDQYQQQSSSGS